MSTTQTALGTKRVKKKDLLLYRKNKKGWEQIHEPIPESTKQAIAHYNKAGNIKFLVDEFFKDFLKGQLNPQSFPVGARISTLPNGKKLARGAFSLFAKNLEFNLDNELLLWDVCYTNTSGSKTYLYCQDKVEYELKKKDKLVFSFEKEYETILKNLEKDIKKKGDLLYVALYILLKTHIRVGHLEYYRHLGHQGLTTLLVENLSIQGNTVHFSYLAKDGVPRDIKKIFPPFVLTILEKEVEKKKSKDFLFTKKDGSLFHSHDFSHILFTYTGKHFYPHIIRSHYANSVVKSFLKQKRKASKKEVEELFLEIARELGHMKFNKKKQNQYSRIS